MTNRKTLMSDKDEMETLILDLEEGAEMSTEEVKALVEELRYGAEYGCDADLIERAADAIEELVADLGDADAMTGMWMRKYEALQAQLPKRGEWIRHPEVKNIYGGVYIECPFCGEKYVVQYIADEKFCRNCGADMRAKMEVQE